MSLDALKDFGKKVMEDADLKAKAKKVGMENVDGIIALAKENGFDISKEDFIAAAKEAQSSDELNEDDLEKIAGGVATSTAAAAVGVAAAVVGAAAGVTSTIQGGGW
jgi:predicted ribosomally synthesized peptide with nif11-like leader